MIPNFSRSDVEELLSQYLTPSQTISQQERLHGRAKQLEMIKRALRSPGRHVFIYGDRGVGKTSLAKTAASLVQPSEQDLTLIACDQENQFAHFVQDIAKKLHGGVVRIDRTTERIDGGLNLGPVKVGKQIVVEKGVIPAISTINDAVELLRQTRKENFSKDPVIIVDEFDQLADPRDMKLFADLIKQVSDQEVGLKFIFCGIGSTLEELIGVHLSTDRYVAPVELEPIGFEARWEIINNAAEAFKINIDRETVLRIGHISDGFPYYVHLIGEQLVWGMFDAEWDCTEANISFYQAAVNQAIECSYTTLKRAYELAIQKYKHSEEYEEVLWAIAEGRLFQRSTDDIYTNSYLPIMRLRKKDPLARQVFSQRLNSLKKDGHGRIINAPRRSWYTFTENMVRGYVRLRAEKSGVQLGADHLLAKSQFG